MHVHLPCCLGRNAFGGPFQKIPLALSVEKSTMNIGFLCTEGGKGGGGEVRVEERRGCEECGGEGMEQRIETGWRRGDKRTIV